MHIEEIVDLYAAAFMASASKLALMLKDPDHLNYKSVDWRSEFEVMVGHAEDAFQAKNIANDAKQTLKAVNAQSHSSQEK